MGLHGGVYNQGAPHPGSQAPSANSAVRWVLAIVILVVVIVAALLLIT
jgi:hypothetical protein